jgi:hypothetical protein
MSKQFSKAYSLSGKRRSVYDEEKKEMKANPWHEHCKAFAKKNNVTYAAAISLASQSWREKKAAGGMEFRDRTNETARRKEIRASKQARIREVRNEGKRNKASKESFAPKIKSGSGSSRAEREEDYASERKVRYQESESEDEGYDRRVYERDQERKVRQKERKEVREKSIPTKKRKAVQAEKEEGEYHRYTPAAKRMKEQSQSYSNRDSRSHYEEGYSSSE